MTNLGGFQQYLVEKGWKRYTKDFIRGQWVIKENYTDNFLSTYGPLEYFFSHPDYPGFEFWYGLSDKDKPPVFSLYPIKVQNNGAHKSKEDCFRTVLAKVEYDKIYEVIIKRGSFIINDSKVECVL